MAKFISMDRFKGGALLEVFNRGMRDIAKILWPRTLTRKKPEH